MASDLQFVVQLHQTSESAHWDLMLEQAESLATWHVPIPPEQVGNQPQPIERIFDHPKRFLTYEGPLRTHPGHVRIHDRGTYKVLSQSENTWLVSIAGRDLMGTFRLEQVSDADPSLWQIRRFENAPPGETTRPTGS